MNSESRAGAFEYSSGQQDEWKNVDLHSTPELEAVLQQFQENDFLLMRAIGELSIRNQDKQEYVQFWSKPSDAHNATGLRPKLIVGMYLSPKFNSDLVEYIERTNGRLTKSDESETNDLHQGDESGQSINLRRDNLSDTSLSAASDRKDGEFEEEKCRTDPRTHKFWGPDTRITEVRNPSTSSKHSSAKSSKSSNPRGSDKAKEKKTPSATSKTDTSKSGDSTQLKGYLNPLGYLTELTLRDYLREKYESDVEELPRVFFEIENCKYVDKSFMEADFIFRTRNAIAFPPRGDYVLLESCHRKGTSWEAKEKAHTTQKNTIIIGEVKQTWPHGNRSVSLPEYLAASFKISAMLANIYPGPTHQVGLFYNGDRASSVVNQMQKALVCIKEPGRVDVCQTFYFRFTRLLMKKHKEKTKLEAMLNQMNKQLNELKAEVKELNAKLNQINKVNELKK